MGPPSRAEMEAAFQRYLELGAYQRDWNAWADLFTEDACYVPIAFPSLTVLQYRDGLWCHELDVYDVRRSIEAKEAFRLARAAALR
jgi:hypothetical protein